MSESAIRAKIKTALSGVSGIGAVYDRERYADTWAEWFTLMTSGGKINGWTISRENTSAQYDTATTIRREHRYAIHGFYDVSDSGASETTFQALLDGIFTAFAGNWRLDGVVLLLEPAQIEFVGVDLFGDEMVNRLLHVATISLIAAERTFIT